MSVLAFLDFSWVDYLCCANRAEAHISNVFRFGAKIRKCEWICECRLERG